MLVNNWLGRLRFRTSPRRSRQQHRRRRTSRFGPLAFVESLESRTLLSAPAIAGLGLLNDTGTPGDQITIDPRVTGTVTNDDGVSGLTVEIDRDGDGMVDDWTTTDYDGVFVYDLGPAMYGEITVSARPVEIDPLFGTHTYGAWVSLTFTFHNEPASVATFGVLNNVGSAQYPRTIDGLVAGTVTNSDGGVSGLNVEFDYDGNGTPDDYTTTDVDGEFTYNVGMMVGDGLHTIYARVNESDTHGEVLGEWRELSFRYITAPEITSFMAYYVGNYQWRLEGTVSYFDPASLTIQFGGLVDGTEPVQSDGSFSALRIIYDSGFVSAQTTDAFGRDSNLAEDYVMNV